ncbi:restriction endonuclease subunit S [Listeria monocytogenes]|nr:restriction endonuclease subunit S [Listeria monocytogenes]
MKKLEKSVPVIRFKGFSEAWEQRKFIEIINRLSKTSNSSILPKVEYEDIIAEEGRLNKDISNKFDSRKGILFQPNNILYGKLRPYLKNWLYPDFKGVAVGDFWVFEAIEATPRFIYNLIQTDSYQKVANDTAGTKMPRSDWTKVSNSSFFIPKESSEQKRIGSFFKQLDNTIALHQHKLDTLKQMKKGFSQQIFPENDRKKPKIRFNSFCEEWEQRKIGEYGYFYYGKSAPKWSVTQDATTPCVRYGELYTKFGPEIDIVHSYTNIDKSNLKFSSGNEVLVPRVGENPLDFANCSWLSLSNVAIGEMISVYNTEQYPLFIAYYFRSKMKYEFAKRVEGGNVSNLYYSYLEDILISVPSIDEQKKIAEFLNKIDITINLLQNKLDRIKELKKAYLQNMFI